MEQRGLLEAMQALETKSDEELEAETRFKAQAQAILGARAAERYDAKKARAHFQKAMVAAKPRSGCSCARWPTRRSRSPSAAPATSRRPRRSLVLRLRLAASCSGCACLA